MILNSPVLASPPAHSGVGAVTVGVNAGVILPIGVWFIIYSFGLSSLTLVLIFFAVFAESGKSQGIRLGLVTTVRTALH